LFIFLLLFYPLWLNAAEPWVYVTNNGSDSMTIINTATDEVLTTLPVGKEPHEVAITPDSKKAYVAVYGENVVAVIDLQNLRVVKRIATGIAPDGIAIALSPEGLKL
jgi:YVTN family beta-propeller protein